MGGPVNAWRPRRLTVRRPSIALLLAVLLGALLTPAAVAQDETLQACCLPDGGCETVSYEACLDLGGVPQGEGTSCADVRCPQPVVTQACCLPDGSCRDKLRSWCTAQGGIPQGRGTCCEEVTCTAWLEACCFTSGDCRDLEAAVCIARGGQPLGTGTSCADSGCPRPCELFDASSIELVAPEAEASLSASDASLRFSWEALGRSDASYQVFYTPNACPEAEAGAHPFAPLLPDPEEGARRSRIVRDRARQEANLAEWRRYCGELASAFDRLRARLAAIPEARRWLEDGAAEAARHQAGEFSLPLPTVCPGGVERLLGDAGSGFADLVPCANGACETLVARLQDLIGSLQSLSARGFVSGLEFARLLDRWIRGAEHRGVFQVYEALFSGIDAAISLVTELLDLVTPDMEQLLQGILEDYLTGEACARAPEGWCDAIDAAATARDKLATLRTLLNGARSSGVVAPAFLVQMVQAMAQQAAAASAVAVEGWERFAEAMGAALWDAYEALLCEEALAGWLLDREAEIRDLCAACERCVTEEIARLDEERAALEAEAERAAAARIAYWAEASAAVSAGIEEALAALGVDWYDRCCCGRERRIEVPGDDPCAAELEAALKAALGDRACFLTFAVECLPEGEISFEYGFPLAERRPGCCIPDATVPLGERGDPGVPGATLRHPEGDAAAEETAARLRELGPGSWWVEACDAAGRLLASSPRRPFGRTPETGVFPRIVPATPPDCTCGVGAAVNGAAVAAGGTIGGLAAGRPATIAVVGDCGPPCDAGLVEIAVRAPLVLVPGPLGTALVSPPPLVVAASSTVYDFPDPGTYRVTVSRTCEDGDRCSAGFDAVVSAPVGPVVRQTGLGEGEACCPACGNDDCMALAYRRDGSLPAVTIFGNRLAVAEPCLLTLELASACGAQPPETGAVRWEITSPSGAFQILEGAGLYRIDHQLEGPGETTFCVIETTDGGRHERWLVVDCERSP